jgi:hypothetical protein
MPARACDARRCGRVRRGTRSRFAQGTVMLDVAMIAAGVGFFAIAVLYVLACERM